MPVQRIAPEPESHPELVQELVRVLRENKSDGPPDEPQIVIEELRYTNHTHVNVIWDRWKDIDLQERGRIILTAIAEALGEGEMLRVSLAMGLTRAEAERIGVTV